MQNEAHLTFWQRSFVGNTWRFFFSRKNWRRNGYILGCFIAAIPIFYGIIDFYGALKWSSFRRQHERNGGLLSFRYYIPDVIPEWKNFAASPSATGWVTQFRHTNQLFKKDSFNKADDLIRFNNHQKLYHRTYLNLVAWSSAFTTGQKQTNVDVSSYLVDQSITRRAQAAPAIFAGLQQDQDLFKELRLASERPFSRYPLVYNPQSPWNILLPHLSQIKSTCERLQLQASAELVLEENQKAFEDVNLIFYLANSVRTEPFLISYLVRIACLHVGVQAIWEGLAQNKWNDAELQVLAESLSHYTLISDIRLPFRAEEGAGVAMINLLQKNPNQIAKNLRDLSGISEDIDNKFFLIVLQLCPSGWLDLEKVHYCQVYDKAMEHLANDNGSRVFPKIVESTQHSDVGLPTRLWRDFVKHNLLLSWLFTPNTPHAMENAAAAQVDIDQARLACTLERYHLAHGVYPPMLKELMPQFIEHLPDDPITGNSYIYQPGYNSRFKLYSIGWDEKDNGGVPGNILFGNQGDWVWEYPKETTH